MDAYHKFGSHWFCLQMLKALNEQCRIFLKPFDLRDKKLERVLPLVFGVRSATRAIGLLRQERLLNEAHILARLLAERVITLCVMIVAEPSETDAISSLPNHGNQKVSSPQSAEELITFAKQMQFSETYDSAALEKKLALLESKTKVHIDCFRLAIATHYPIASAALSGSPFGAICHIGPNSEGDDFFQKEFALLFFSCSCLLHEAVIAISTNPQFANSLGDSDKIMVTASGLMNRVNEPADTHVRDSEGWWDTLTDFEHSAKQRLKEGLDAYENAFCLCAEAGVQVPTLPHSKRGCLSLKFSALFLKRVLNDLRGVWLLLNRGYTSQAAAIAASLYENALAVQCVAGNEAHAQRIAKNPSGELPWSKAEMCKLITSDEKARGESGLRDDEGWKLLYGQYSWLCEIKHPTLHQSIYDAGATAFGNSGYAVMTFPDVRDDNLGTKRLVCLIVLTTTKGAIEAFARGAGVQRKSEQEELYASRMEQVNRIIDQQLNEKGSIRVPFGIRDTNWGKRNLQALPKRTG